MTRVCTECRGSGYLYRTPDSLDARFDSISVGYYDMKCWRCVGEGYLNVNPESPLSVQEESLDSDRTITNEKQVWSE